jgi:2-keto-4-pentenoate hydratase/2-oxohepta-3-ene-1,7-dioic acid hydratase in catechol pathway
MQLLTFQSAQGLKLGIKTERGVIDVAAARTALGGHNQVVETIDGLCTTGTPALAALSELVTAVQGQDGAASWLLREEDLQFGPSVSPLGKIICIGLNYRRHAAESGMAVPTSPVLFPKYGNTLAASGEAVPLQTNAVQYDYEAELAVVIGQQARDISEDRALDYVLGYSNAEDLSARDLQFRTNQWMLGKTLDKFLPIGPYLVTADEVGDPQNLAIRCWLNGELRQDSTTGDMVFSVAYLISYLSQYMTLEPGDIIVTGTPEGVILGMKEQVWVKPGDEIVVEVEKLGRLTNIMSEHVSPSK